MIDRIKVLLLDPGSVDLVQVRYDEELREIENKIQASPFRDSFELIPRSSVRVSDLGTFLLRFRPHIVHFSGHADASGEIVIEDDAGCLTSVGAKDFAKTLHTLKDNIRAVFLNVCHSKTYAEAIAQEIDFVIGMDGVISDEASIAFAGSFYQALAFGRSVKCAFEVAQELLSIRSLAGSEAPVLLIRQGVRDEDPFQRQENRNDYSQPTEANECTERCEELQTSPAAEVAESLEDLRQPDQGAEVWRWESKNGVMKVVAILERNGGLTITFSSSDLDFLGTRLRFCIGPTSHELTLEQLSESEVRGSVEISRRQRPRDFSGISIELV